MKAKIFTIIIILYLSPATFSQTQFTLGGSIGGGSFSGNSSSVAGFTSGVYIEANIPLFAEVFPRVSFVFTKDFNAILPNTDKPYNPFLMGISVKGVTYQFFESKVFLEEGVGLLALNDRTFIDTNVWDYGAVLSISSGYDLRNFNLTGFKFGLGIEYGLTFFNTLPKYSSIYIFAQLTI